MDAVWEYFKKFPLEKAIFTVCLFLICLLIIKIILAFVDRFLKKSKIDALAGKIVRVVIKVVLLFATIMIVLSSLGISVTSLIAAFSVIGVAFSLAIQGFLSNVFGGIQIITNKPFKIGDYVEAGDEAGTVREVGLFYTKLDTPDKKLIQVPNSIIANESIVNYSNALNRRVEFLISVSYDSDCDKVRAVLLELLEEHPMVLKLEDMMPAVHVKEFRDNDITYIARAWCENANYWTVYYDIMDVMKQRLESNGIEFSYPHMNVHMINDK